MSDATFRIEALGRRGEGIAHAAGRTLSIPRSLPGEVVKVEDRGGRLILAEVLSPSQQRVEPFCKHFHSCGGCQLQHWDVGPYRAWKAGLVEKALADRGIAAKAGELIDAHGAGRRRVSLHVRRRDGRVTAGFMAERSHLLLDIDRCPILEEPLVRAFDIGRVIGARLGDCDVAITSTRTGLDVSIRAERQVVGREEASLARIAGELEVARLTVNGDVVATAQPPVVRMGDSDVAIPPGGFLQATALGEEILSRLVDEGIGRAKTAADLFCGIGPFALRLARRMRVEAYDNDRVAVAALSAAARTTSGLKPIAATARDLFREPLVSSELKGFDAIVFDPPRAGAEAQARQIAKSGVKTVVAVSCDVQSFARDAEILIGGSYGLARLDAVDQFKWSSHVEIVGVFRRDRRS